MKFSYKFSNIIGSVYRKGDLVFTKDGNSVISPIGNRIAIFDLKNNKSSALSAEGRYNYTTFDISPNGNILIAVDEDGTGHFISLVSKQVIQRHRFKNKVLCLKFSPDGKYFAACEGNCVLLFRVPGQFGKEFSSFALKKVFHGAFDDTTCIDWTSDSRVLAVGSKDSIARVYSIKRMKNFRICSLSTHFDAITAVFFDANSLDVNTISSNGRICIWEANMELSDLLNCDINEPHEPKSKKALVDMHSTNDAINTEKGEERLLHEDDDADTEKQDATQNLVLKYKRLARHFILNQNTDKNVQLTSAAYHNPTRILISGFSNGLIFIHELPDVNLIHSLSVSNGSISKVAFNITGDWVAVGCAEQGQMLVWEWQSETYVMNQQGHSTIISAFSYSADGQYIVTGGEDGKVKLWNTQSGFCFVTYSEHTSEVTCVKFAPNKRFIVSASSDGTVRLNDMARYRNFRTLTAVRPAQFASLAIDSSSEFIAAGAQDVFEIYVWSVKLGRLLEVLTGHEGPVVGLDFNPTLSSTELASVSWDKSLRIWNAVETGTEYESIKLPADGLCVTYRPDGKEVAVATLDGQISTFDVVTRSQTGFIEGRNDLGSGRADTDLITAKKILQAKSFTCICYSVDGAYIIAGGQSKNICIYNVKTGIIIKKIVVSQNLSLDAVNDCINRRNMTEFGNIALVEERGEFGAVKLPGVRKGDMASRKFKPEVRVSCLAFSPAGQEWAAATTEGLLIYSLDHNYVFDPFLLEETITPDAVKKAKNSQSYSEALMMAIKLNDWNLVKSVIESVPSSDVKLCCASLADVYKNKLLTYIANSFLSTKHVEYYLIWSRALINDQQPRLPATLLSLQKNLKLKYNALSKMCEFNKYSIQYLIRLGDNSSKPNEEMDTTIEC